MKRKWVAALIMSCTLCLTGGIAVCAEDTAGVSTGTVIDSTAGDEPVTEAVPESEDADSTAAAEETQEPEIFDGWVEESDGMHFYVAGVEITAQGYKIDGSWYYFDENGVSMRNWFRQKGAEWYYYDADGCMANNVELDIDGKHYKFTAGGAAYLGWYEDAEGRYYYTGNGYRAAEQGLKIDGSWYYFSEDGKMLTGWREKADGWYYYDENGHLQTSVGLKLDGEWYYFTESGRRLQSEFRQKGSEWYYYDENGCMAKNTELDIDGKHYKFTAGGAAYLGWDETEEGRYYYTGNGYRAADQGLKIDGSWYYFSEDGKMHTGWREKADGRYYYDENGCLLIDKGIKLDGEWYYLNETGRMLQEDFRKKGEDWYYYDAEGHMLKDTGLITINDENYWFQSDGAAYRGLMTLEDEEGGQIVIGFTPTGQQAFDAGVKDNGSWYYFDADGNMVKSQWRDKDGARYYYQKDGKMAANKGMKIWIYWYYFDETGRMHTGWRDKGADRYYYDTDGHMVAGRGIKVGSYWYYFTESGKMHTGWRVKGTDRYYYYPDGHMAAGETALIDGTAYHFDSDGKLKDFPTCIGLFTTVSTNNYNSTYNMTKALLCFNGIVLQPGETLSFFNVTGPCGAADGYLPGGVVGGIGYGGGICQASTTLYGAALRAGMTIIDRQNHSVPSTYVPIGQDAMVNYGTSDLQFRNDHSYPVRIVTYVVGNTLFAEIWGVQPAWYDSVEISSWWTGSHTAVAYRQYIKNGTVVKSEQLPSSYYR